MPHESMSPEEAAALERFIRDHDTRFTPAAGGEGADAYVLLKKSDGEETTVHSAAEYREKFIEAASPGPTIEEAWAKWMPQ
jgi:hypothetical protein